MAISTRCLPWVLTSVFCLATAAEATPKVNASETRQPPNIVFILADDLGYGDLSCFGQHKFSTPHLDRLAESGLRLTQHYAGCTVCAPSRCSLMTGLHTGHCQVRGNQETMPFGQHPLTADTVTLPLLLQQAGYATGVFGKWGLGYTGSTGDPSLHGVEQFFGYKCQRRAHRYYAPFLWKNNKQVTIDPSAYTHDLIVEQSLDFIRANRNGPFFCFLPVAIPHAAMEIPEDRRANFRQQFAEFEDRPGKYYDADLPNPIATFAAMMTQLDGDVGRIVALLKEMKLEQNTIIIFSSDNGPHLEGGHDPRFFNSNGNLRGFKRDLYEGGIRVPTIVNWPGKIAAGRASTHLSAFWDWLPTLVQLSGAEPPQTIDGVSLLPTLLDQPGQQEHDYLYWEFHEGGGKQALRRGDWKAVRLNVGKQPGGPIELYNLAKDQGETNDVAAANRELAIELMNLMNQARTPSPVFDFGR